MEAADTGAIKRCAQLVSNLGERLLGGVRKRARVYEGKSVWKRGRGLVYGKTSTWEKECMDSTRSDAPSDMEAAHTRAIELLPQLVSSPKKRREEERGRREGGYRLAERPESTEGGVQAMDVEDTVAAE